jgi:hypothetical protein
VQRKNKSTVAAGDFLLAPLIYQCDKKIMLAKRYRKVSKSLNGVFGVKEKGPST